MSTLKAQLLKVALNIDPRIKSNGAFFVESTIGTVDGDRFSKEQLLQGYNTARTSLLTALMAQYSDRQLAREVSGQITRDAAFSFSGGSATKPTGYIKLLSLMDAAGRIISPVTPNEYAMLKHLDGYGNPIVVEEGSAFVAVSTTNVPNGSDYVLRYLGLTDWTLSSLATAETFNTRWEPILVEIAVAALQGLGTAELNALAFRLVSEVKDNAFVKAVDR